MGSFSMVLIIKRAGGSFRETPAMARKTDAGEELRRVRRGRRERRGWDIE
jgi:hypothetical protein